MGHVYEVGDLCDENVAKALGADAVPADEADAAEAGDEGASSEEGGDAPAEGRKTKPVKKASVK